MKKRMFIKNGLAAFGAFTILPKLTACSSKDKEAVVDASDCTASPSETAGPFPTKSPADSILQDIRGDRMGIPLTVNIKIENVSNNCKAQEGTLVDIWHCDSQGNYSEYNGQVDGDFTSEHWLRGRQTTDPTGFVRFVTNYPGWYPGRAPHIHIEVRSAAGHLILTTQMAFPENISTTVYSTEHYNGAHDTSNSLDGEFRNSLNRNLVESTSGSVDVDYVFDDVIKVEI